MNVLVVILVLVIIGVIMWYVNAKVPMQPAIKTILNIVVVILVIIYLLRAFGVWDDVASARL